MSEDKYYPTHAWAIGVRNDGATWRNYPNQDVLEVGIESVGCAIGDNPTSVQVTLEQAKVLYAEIGAWLAEQEGKTT